MTILAEDYLAGYGGSPSEYRYNLKVGQRIGQAFFNALSGADQELLSGTTHDPFYSMHGPAVLRAIEFLLDSK